MNIRILGKKGKLSKGLNDLYNQNRSEYIHSSKEDIQYLIATFSPTLRIDNEQNYYKEINYYQQLIDSLNTKQYIIYISSQTLELSDFTYYSKAKLEVERIIKSYINQYTIIRVGMIYNEIKNEYNLASMNKASDSIFSFYNDHKKTTACTIEDIYNLINLIVINNKHYEGKTINLGLKRMNFIQLQNIKNEKKYRFKILSFFFLRILSIFNVRLKSYTLGKASSISPMHGHESYFDKLK